MPLPCRALPLAVLLFAALVQAAEPALQPFDSDEGLARLARSTAKVDFAPLANQFEAQSNAAFCGPTSAAIVLNALSGPLPDLPHDRLRLSEADFRYVTGWDLTIARYTQDNVIAGAKTRAQVFGEPLMINQQPTTDYGYQLRQLDDLLRANGAATRLVIVDAQADEAAIHADLVGNLQRRGDYLIVAYQRTAVGQPGGGHISPVAAYDAASDSLLILDVNPSVAGWVWMPMATLIRAMGTFDTVENRGYLQVGPP